jgi:hypothetical protein
MTQQACWTPITHEASARPGRTTAGYKNELLSAADVFVIKSPTVHSAINKKYGAKEQHGKATFPPTEQECTYYQHLLVHHYKRNFLSSADAVNVKSTSHSETKEKVGGTEQDRRNERFARRYTGNVSIYKQGLPAPQFKYSFLSSAYAVHIKRS